MLINKLIISGIKLWVLELSTAPADKLGVPSVKLIGNIHGNEPVGREVLLHLIEFFVMNYESDDKVRWLLDNTRIHILPCLNPDGFQISIQGRCGVGPGRENRRHVDLNRSFPDYFQMNSVPSQDETEAVKSWLHNNTFVLSASLHGGALVANYPYENVKENIQTEINAPSVSPDDDVFQHLAMTYSYKHPSMHRGESCNIKERGFPNGITNGAAWYTFTGGMQDYNYVFHGCMEITLEISCCKYPHASQLPQLWTDNKAALLVYIREVHLGVKGLVLDSVTAQPVNNVSLRIAGREIPFRTSPRGEFWRILLPGDYQLEVTAPGYVQQKIPFTVPLVKNSQPVWLNVTMSTFEHQHTTKTVVTDTTEQYSTTTIRESSEHSTKTLEVLDSNYEQMAITAGTDTATCNLITMLACGLIMYNTYLTT
ncbi:hypothetical protein L9F63_011384 [Diploptera punctata]|uniref:Peptidase M14 domain-containing protein n=1 Tax=Diploptera punctata TaxID=6984 RepID=A0AAD8EPL7_DIPPU|nr:hypothetical protein L9F63_011384 [Diploptera punctata]